MRRPATILRAATSEAQIPSQPMTERFRFRHVNAITGTFVLLVVAVLIVAIAWSGHSQRWFQSYVTLQIVLPEAGAAGIQPGSEVYFLGTLVGSVADVLVKPTGRMETRTRIRRDFFLFVRADSTAAVKRKFGVAGDAYFEITRGAGSPLPERNASIACAELSGTVESAIEEVRQAALPVLQKLSGGLDTWNLLGTQLNATRQRLDDVIGRLDAIVDGIGQGKGTAGRLLTDTALVDEAQQLLTRANATVDSLQNIVTTLDAAAENVRSGTDRLPEITGAVADEAKDLAGLVRQTQIAMRELQRLVEAAQRHWLVRKRIDHADPPPLTMPAGNAGPDR